MLCTKAMTRPRWRGGGLHDGAPEGVAGEVGVGVAPVGGDEAAEEGLDVAVGVDLAEAAEDEVVVGLEGGGVEEGDAAVGRVPGDGDAVAPDADGGAGVSVLLADVAGLFARAGFEDGGGDGVAEVGRALGLGRVEGRGEEQGGGERAEHRRLPSRVQRACGWQATGRSPPVQGRGGWRSCGSGPSRRVGCRGWRRCRARWG